MSNGLCVYLVYTPCSGNWEENLESILYEAAQYQRMMNVDVICEVISPSGFMTDAQQLDCVTYHSCLQDHMFSLVLFKGEDAPPYIEALLRAAGLHTPVLNGATENSQLDFCIQLHMQERAQLTRA